MSLSLPELIERLTARGHKVYTCSSDEDTWTVKYLQDDVWVETTYRFVDLEYQASQLGYDPREFISVAMQCASEYLASMKTKKRLQQITSPGYYD